MKKNERKVMLFVVEGISDKVSFQSVLENFFEQFNVKVAVMRGDVTIDNSPDPSEIKAVMSDKVNEFCGMEKIRFPEDIVSITHLIDTDGAFIPDNCVIGKADGTLEYTDSAIIAMNPDSIRKRNRIKSTVVNKLATMGKLNGVDYKVYYFSRNLEHVLHNDGSSLSASEKRVLSEKFDDMYADNLQGFLEFIAGSTFAARGDYKETWSFIRQGLNSLSRHSNFHLLFSRQTGSSS